MQSKPYFMSNEEWYYFDDADFKYKLTDKATDEARKSYDEFYWDGDEEEIILK